MTDPLDAYGDALRRALHTEMDVYPTFVCAPDALDRIRARTSRAGWLGQTRAHDLIAVAALLIILLFALGGS